MSIKRFISKIKECQHQAQRSERNGKLRWRLYTTWILMESFNRWYVANILSAVTWSREEGTNMGWDLVLCLAFQAIPWIYICKNFILYFICFSCECMNLYILEIPKKTQVQLQLSTLRLNWNQMKMTILKCWKIMAK